MPNINFTPWVDDSVVSDENQNVVYGYNDFNNNSQRQNGFKPNTVSSSKLVNTALRQANLFVSSLAKALLNDVDYDSDGNAVINDIDLKTSEEHLTKVIKNAFPFAFSTPLKHSKLKPGTVDYSSLFDDAATSNISTALDGYLFDTSIYTYFRRIFGPNISSPTGGDINAPLANYQSSKGSIESRLNDFDSRLEKLGFKSGVISFAGTDYGSTSATDTSGNGIFRQGNYVIGKVYFTDKSLDILKYGLTGSTLFSISDPNFYPKNNITFYIFIKSYNSDLVRTLEVELSSETGNAVVLHIFDGRLEGNPVRSRVEFIFGYEANPIT